MSSEQPSALCCSPSTSSTTLPHDPNCANYSRRPRRQTKRARQDDELVDFRLQQELDIARRQSLAISTAPPPPPLQQSSSSLSPPPPRPRTAPRASSPANPPEQSGTNGPKKRKPRAQAVRSSDVEDASDDSYKARTSKRKRTAAAAKSSSASLKKPPAPPPSRRPSNPRSAGNKASRSGKTASRARSQARATATPRDKTDVAPSAEPVERQLQHWTAPCAQTYQVSVGGVTVMIGVNSRRLNAGQ
ncbi:hypothetical protein BDZ88DRAFT_448385 [Geranomyces variabilis]|nr:hypothetical protein BDZ88DRAFT_448385 [Geranomyces variabilis]KAJ3143455.1 hypothetical protein HDU90_000216 [Geranomyces variabilis]